MRCEAHGVQVHHRRLCGVLMVASCEPTTIETLVVHIVQCRTHAIPLLVRGVETAVAGVTRMLSNIFALVTVGGIGVRDVFVK